MYVIVQCTLYMNGAKPGTYPHDMTNEHMKACTHVQLGTCVHAKKDLCTRKCAQSTILL